MRQLAKRHPAAPVALLALLAWSAAIFPWLLAPYAGVLAILAVRWLSVSPGSRIRACSTRHAERDFYADKYRQAKP